MLLLDFRSRPPGIGGAPDGVHRGAHRVGLDKATNLLTDWPRYLAPWIDGIAPGTAQQAMYAVGVGEVVAGVVVTAVPRFGAWLVAAWLAGIIVDLATIPGYDDVALRDLGLLGAAVALARLAARYARDHRVHPGPAA
jgi:hypothetical protein